MQPPDEKAVEADQLASGHDPWALQVLEIKDGRIVELTFFLDTERIFALFGLPDHLPA